MTHARMLSISVRWFRILQRLYPLDFRDQLAEEVVEVYMNRARDALHAGGRKQLVVLWARALVDSLRNGAAERVNPAASWRRAGDWGRDVELVWRRLARSPGFSVTAITTLTVGLGMFAVVYTTVQKTLVDPMPYKEAGDLYYVWRDYGSISDMRRGSLAGTDITELQKPNSVIEDAVGLQALPSGILSLREGGDPTEIAVTLVSPNLFSVLGVTAALGRCFAPDEAGPGRGQVIVLTHMLWKRLGADPAIVGTQVRLQGRPRTVIGVLPHDFSFVRSDSVAPPQRVDAYIPFEVDLGRSNPGTFAYAGLIRARHGASPEAVGTAVDVIGRIIDERDFDGRGMTLRTVGLKADVISRIRPALVVLAASGAVLVLMLMVNLASVLLSRAAQREHELGVSRALGANSIAIMRATLFEGGLLGVIGGTLGALAALWGTRALVALAPVDLPRREAITMDWRIGATVVAVGGLLGILAAAAPAVWAARVSLSSILASSAVRGGGAHNRLRRSMIVGQVALTLVLLSSGALVARSFERLLRADPGFRPEGVLTFRIWTPPEFFPRTSDALAFQDRLQRVLGTVPGVTGASGASALPLTGTAYQTTVSIPGAPGNTGDLERDKIHADIIGVRDNYVEVMGMRLLAGHSFAGPRLNGALEAIIDSTIANRLFPQASPLGATVQLQNLSAVVVGVVQQARLYDVHSDGRPQVLIRVNEQFGFRSFFFAVHTTREPRSLLPEIQSAVHRLDARVPVGDPRSMDAIVGQSLIPQSIGASLLGAFGASALLLAAMGLFGVVSGSVMRRRHELAVRLALGADHASVLRLVLKEGMLLVTIGLLIGAPGIYLANSLIRGLLVATSSFDPLALMVAAIGLLLVGLVTCYVPARGTLRIEPARLLRQA